MSPSFDPAVAVDSCCGSVHSFVKLNVEAPATVKGPSGLFCFLRLVVAQQLSLALYKLLSELRRTKICSDGSQKNVVTWCVFMLMNVQFQCSIAGLRCRTQHHCGSLRFHDDLNVMMNISRGLPARRRLDDEITKFNVEVLS